MPKISVVVPVYKVEAYLSRCIDSILEQTYRDFELILVDDGSPDNCLEMCERYAESDNKIHVIHRENGGLSAARNSGIEWVLANSDSEWITFIDSDDWIHERYLEWLLQTAKDYDVNVVIGTFIRTDGKEDIVQHNGLTTEQYATEDCWLKIKTNATTAWGKLYKLSDFQTLRYPEGKLHEDEFTTYQVLFQYDYVAVVETPIYYYYFNPDSITKSAWSPRRLDGLEAVKNQMEYFKANGFDRAYRWAVWCYLDALCEHMRAIRDKKQYQEYLKKLRNEIRRGIKEYKTLLNLSYQTSYRFYKYAYPIRAKIYRKLRKNQ